MCVRKWLVSAAIFSIAAAAPRTASADWTLTPFIGANFGGSADVSGNGGPTVSNKFEKKIDYGASLTSMGRGPLGFELDFGYSPNFFESSTTATGFQFTNSSNVTTVMGNLVIGASGGGVRPYVVGGVGLLRTNVQDFEQTFTVNTKNDFGMDLGGGVTGFFSKSVGLRGDVRYFRGFRGTSDNVSGVALSDFKFWRASLGLALKF
jgi:opacity protein-like surface antigen